MTRMVTRKKRRVPITCLHWAHRERVVERFGWVPVLLIAEGRVTKRGRRKLRPPWLE